MEFLGFCCYFLLLSRYQIRMLIDFRHENMGLNLRLDQGWKKIEWTFKIEWDEANISWDKSEQATEEQDEWLEWGGWRMNIENQGYHMKQQANEHLLMRLYKEHVILNIVSFISITQSDHTDIILLVEAYW